MENNYAVNAPQENLLDDLGVNLVRASAGQRFLNYIIDGIVFIGILGGLAAVAPALAQIVFFPFMPYITFAVYIGLLESALKGKTLGKLITRTRAVQIDGTPITSGIAFQRGFSRIVPFEPFSALGSDTNPWHDRWTRTYVIDEKESRGV